MMKPLLTCMGAAVVILLASPASGAVTTLDALRIYSVQPQSFEFMFMSAMGSGPQTRLAFNHVDGATHIVRVGEKLGDYTVAEYTPTSERIFNASINAYQERKGGTVTLRDSIGRDIVLEMGISRDTPGWTACLVATNSGAWTFVGPGDELVIDAQPVRITEVTDQRATLLSAGNRSEVPWATDTERDALQKLWEERRRQQEIEDTLQRQRAELPAEEEILPVHAPLRVRDNRRSQDWFSSSHRNASHFGVEYPYPIEYEIRPVMVRLPNGETRLRPIVVPTRFVRRSTGISSMMVTPRLPRETPRLPNETPRLP